MLAGKLDLLLAAAMLLFAISVHWVNQAPLPALIDFLAYGAAALVVRSPRAGGIFLSLVLISLLFLPLEGRTLAEHAALIPILTTGIRGQRRERLWMTIGFGTILSMIIIEDSGRDLVPNGVMMLGLNTLVIALTWVVGDAFTAHRVALERAHAKDMQQRQAALARDLHDTVARELSRASLQAQSLMEQRNVPELKVVVNGIQQASTQLRWMLALLRDPTSSTAMEPAPSELHSVIDSAQTTLRSCGFTVTVAAEGDPSAVPRRVMPTVEAAVNEAIANIERHADPRQPCTIFVSITPDMLDLLFLNTMLDAAYQTAQTGIGLVGMRERLALIAGEVTTEQKGKQWITQITVPLGRPPSA